MLQTFGLQPRLKTTIITNKKGTVSKAIEICFMGSNKFLANKKYEVICSLCLAEAKGYPFMGEKTVFLEREGCWGWEGLWLAIEKVCQLTEFGGSAGFLSQAALIPQLSEARRETKGNASNCPREVRAVRFACLQPKPQGSRKATVGNTEDSCLFPGITREIYKPDY